MAMIENTPAFYTVEDITRIFQVHENTVYNWIESGELKAVKIGGLWRIPQDSLPKLEVSHGNA